MFPIDDVIMNQVKSVEQATAARTFSGSLTFGIGYNAVYIVKSVNKCSLT